MVNPTWAVAAAIALSGCSGLDIYSVSSRDVACARGELTCTGIGKLTRPSKPLDGYVVYEPMLIVQVGMVRICKGKEDAAGNCDGSVITQCAVSEPLLIPNLERPYTVRSKTGLGKAGVDVTIVDGWRLGQIKDESDNSAILTTLSDLVPERNTKGVTRSECNEGTYRWDVQNGVPQLIRLKE